MPPGQNLGEESELTGGIIYLIWPGNGLGFRAGKRFWGKWCLQCPAQPAASVTPDKEREVDGRLECSLIINTGSVMATA